MLDLRCDEAPLGSQKRGITLAAVTLMMSKETMKRKA